MRKTYQSVPKDAHTAQRRSNERRSEHETCMSPIPQLGGPMQGQIDLPVRDRFESAYLKIPTGQIGEKDPDRITSVYAIGLGEGSCVLRAIQLQRILTAY